MRRVNSFAWCAAVVVVAVILFPALAHAQGAGTRVKTFKRPAPGDSRTAVRESVKTVNAPDMLADASSWKISPAFMDSLPLGGPRVYYPGVVTVPMAAGYGGWRGAGCDPVVAIGSTPGFVQAYWRGGYTTNARVGSYTWNGAPSLSYYQSYPTFGAAGLGYPSFGNGYYSGWRGGRGRW